MWHYRFARKRAKKNLQQTISLLGFPLQWGALQKFNGAIAWTKGNEVDMELLMMECLLRHSHEPDLSPENRVKDKPEKQEPWDAPQSQIFEPWTREQVLDFRAKHPPVSIWRVLALQALAGVILTLVLGFCLSDVAWVYSCAYAVLCVILPNVVFVRFLQRLQELGSASSSAAGFVVLELLKLFLSVALLAAAPWVVKGLSWPWLMLGLVVTLKAQWLAWFWSK